MPVEENVKGPAVQSAEEDMDYIWNIQRMQRHPSENHKLRGG